MIIQQFPYSGWFCAQYSNLWWIKSLFRLFNLVTFLLAALAHANLMPFRKIMIWRTECWLWSFSSNVSSEPLGKWLSSFTRASKPNFCREKTRAHSLRSRTSECIQCFKVGLCLYLFYEIKALSIVHPVDIIPDQPFSMNTQKEIKWQRIRCLPCALVAFEVRFGWWCVECVCLYICNDILVVLKLL